jgi:hypothetical protein
METVKDLTWPRNTVRPECYLALPQLARPSREQVTEEFVVDPLKHPCVPLLGQP